MNDHRLSRGWKLCHAAFLRERELLTDALEQAPPEAKTLTGWNATQLLAHLVAQERWAGMHLIVATPAVVVLPARLRDRVRRRVLEQPERALLARTSRDALLERLRRPPPIVFRAPGVVETRLIEAWVHHEDLRRLEHAAPRASDAEIEPALWRALRLVAFRATAPPATRIVLRSLRDRRIQLSRSAKGHAEVTGPPGELLLFAMGRYAHAHVEISGDPDAVQTLRHGSPLL